MPHPVSPPPLYSPQEMWTNMKSDGRLSSRPRERSIGQPNNMPVLVRSRAAKKTKNKTKTERESSFPLNHWVVDKDLYSYFFKSWSRWREEEARRQSKASQLDNCWEWSASFSGAGPEFQLTLSHCWQMKKRNDVSGREPREKNLLKKTKCWLKQQSPMQICRRSERKKKELTEDPPSSSALPSAIDSGHSGKTTREADPGSRPTERLLSQLHDRSRGQCDVFWNIDEYVWQHQIFNGSASSLCVRKISHEEGDIDYSARLLVFPGGNRRGLPSSIESLQYLYLHSGYNVYIHVHPPTHTHTYDILCSVYWDKAGEG